MLAPLAAAVMLATTCTAGDTRATFTRFVVAYNVGDTATLDSLFAPEPDFGWYSAGSPGPRLRAAAFKRSTLIPYFRARHARATGSGSSRFDSTASAAGSVISRSSSTDVPATTARAAGSTFQGKGALSCALEPNEFVVVSIGGPMRKA